MLLDGVRVIGLAQYGAGPYALQHLADLGADVIKIERPGDGGGDYARRLPPYASAEANDSLFFQAFNRGQRSVTLDVEHPLGREILTDLVRRADICFNNMRSGLAGSLGLDYATLGAHNPRIVCCSLTGYGPRSDRADEPGFDYIVQAESGIMSLAGDPDGPPVKAGVSIIDFATGIAASFAMLAGLTSARVTGRGGDVATSLMDTALSLTNYMSTWHLSAGYQPERLKDSAHPSLVPSQIFECRDGRHLVVMVNKERFWPSLCEAIGRPHWATDPAYRDFSARLANRDRLVAELGAVLAEHPLDHWLKVLRDDAGVPCGPVNSLEDAYQDPDIQRRTVEFPHEVFGRVVSPGPLVTAENHPTPRRAPALGEHSEEVLCGLLGLSTTELGQLREQGVV